MENDNQTRSQLKTFLFPFVRYRETYQEIFDHVLKTLETDQQPFSQSYVCQIIEEDFGGAEGINQMEKNSLKAMKTKVSKNYWEELKFNFRGRRIFDLFGITIMWSIIGFFPTNRLYLNVYTLHPILIIILIIGLKFYFRYKKEKVSLYSEILFDSTLKKLSLVALFLLMFLLGSRYFDLSRLSFALIVSFILVSFLLNFKVFWRLHIKNLTLRTT